MRKVLTLVLFVVLVSGFETSAQFIPHRLNLGFGGDIQTPISPKIKEQALTTFGNYDLGAGFNVFLEYNAYRNLWLGVSYSQDYFTKNDKEIVIPVTRDPSSIFVDYSIRATYLLGRPMTTRWEYGIVGTFGIVTHTLSIQNPFEGTAAGSTAEPDLSYNESEFSSSLGFILNYSLSYAFDFYASTTYHFMSADNLLYQDQSFQSVGLTIGLKMKLLKNKGIQYE